MRKDYDHFSSLSLFCSLALILSPCFNQEKLIKDTLIRTMVEPRRRCFSLPAVDLKKHAVGGVVNVMVVSAKNLCKAPVQAVSRSSSGEKRSPNNNSGSQGGRVLSTFVEMTLEDLTRKTSLCSTGGSAPTWTDNFDMVLHEDTGTIHLNVYEQGTNNMKFDFLGSCEIKVRVPLLAAPVNIVYMGRISCYSCSVRISSCLVSDY